MPLMNVVNGRTTQFDVDKLFAHVNTKTEGATITHEELAALIGVKYGESRYQTVVNALRRRMLRELHTDLQSLRGVGYRLPTGPDEMKGEVAKFRSGTRKQGRAAAKIALISDDRLPDPKDRATRDYLVRQANYMYELAKAETRTLELRLGKPEVAPQLTAK